MRCRRKVRLGIGFWGRDETSFLGRKTCRDWLSAFLGIVLIDTRSLQSRRRPLGWMCIFLLARFGRGSGKSFSGCFDRCEGEQMFWEGKEISLACMASMYWVVSMKCCENKGGFSAVCLRTQGGVVCGVNYVGSPKNTNVTSRCIGILSILSKNRIIYLIGL